MPSRPSRMPSRIVSMLVSISMFSTSALPFKLAYAQSAAEPAAQSAKASSGKVYSQQELDELLAPIALHPDSLLAQILMASTYPLDVVEAARWRKANPKVQDKALETAMEAQRWDPSVKSLTAFPNVLDMMNEKLEWTQQLGDAFLGQQKQVMDTVQMLRGKAKAAGSLESSKEQTVSTKVDEGKTVIVVEPASPQTIYVPTYNPAVVYGTWWYPAPPPYYYYPPGYVPGAAFFSFAVGVAVGSWLWGGCGWGHGSVNININNFNRVNHTNISNSNWSHNVENRRGVPYNSQGARSQYGDKAAQTRNMQSRDEFRGRAESGRQELGQDFDRGAAQNRAGTSDRSAAQNRAGTSDRGAVQDRAGSPDRGSVQDRSAGSMDRSAGRDSASSMGSSNRAASADRGAAFSNMNQGSRANDFSSRGSTSRASAGAAHGGARAGGGGRGGRR